MRTQSHVLLDRDERRILREAAARNGQSLSDFLRSVGLAKAKRMGLVPVAEPAKEPA